MPLMICFTVWSSLEKSGCWTRRSFEVPSNGKTLFYSHVSSGESRRELGPWLPVKRSLRAFLTKLYTCLKGRHREDGARLFSEVSSARTRGSGHQLKGRRLCLTVPGHFFRVSETEQLHRFPQEVVDSPSSETRESSLDTALGSRPWVRLLEAAA